MRWLRCLLGHDWLMTSERYRRRPVRQCHRCGKRRWRPDRAGYTRRVEAAGRYTRDEAISISHRARDGWEPTEIPTELPVLIKDLPEWARNKLLSAA